MGISSHGEGTLSLENAIWNQCILQIHRSNASSIKNKQPPKFLCAVEIPR